MIRIDINTEQHCSKRWAESQKAANVFRKLLRAVVDALEKLVCGLLVNETWYKKK